MASQISYICAKRREFYLSHLPACFTDSTKCSLLESPAVFADSRFAEHDVSRLLDATWSTSSFNNPWLMWLRKVLRPSLVAAGLVLDALRVALPLLAVANVSGSPARSQKRVCFDSPAPASALKSSRKPFRE